MLVSTGWQRQTFMVKTVILQPQITMRHNDVLQVRQQKQGLTSVVAFVALQTFDQLGTVPANGLVRTFAEAKCFSLMISCTLHLTAE